MGVGQPHGIWLNAFGDYLHAAFGHTAYQVGSSLANKDGWRDVDVRLLLPDDEWAAMGLPKPGSEHLSRKWIALTLAWSAFGRQLTSLPIDFQIQQQSAANREFSIGAGHRRNALFTVSNLLTGDEWNALEARRQAARSIEAATPETERE